MLQPRFRYMDTNVPFCQAKSVGDNERPRTLELQQESDGQRRVAGLPNYRNAPSDGSEPSFIAPMAHSNAHLRRMKRRRRLIRHRNSAALYSTVPDASQAQVRHVEPRYFRQAVRQRLEAERTMLGSRQRDGNVERRAAETLLFLSQRRSVDVAR